MVALVVLVLLPATAPVFVFLTPAVVDFLLTAVPFAFLLTTVLFVLTPVTLPFAFLTVVTLVVFVLTIVDDLLTGVYTRCARTTR